MMETFAGKTSHTTTFMMFYLSNRLPFVGGVSRPFFGLHSRLAPPSLSAQGCVLEDDHFDRTTDVGVPHTRRVSPNIRR